MELLDKKDLQPVAQPALGELFEKLFHELRQLIAEEIRLARREMQEKLASLTGSAVMLGAGLVLAHAGVLALVAGLAAVLVAGGLSVWLSILMVAVATLVIGGGLALLGLKSARQISLAPQETLATLKEDVQWAKHRMQ